MARRLFAAASCTATLLAVLLVPATPARAELGVDDYPDALRQAGLGSRIDPWRFYNRYCTSFVAWRINDLLGASSGNWRFTNFTGGGQFSNARNWDENARRIGWRVDRRPVPGAVYQTETTSRGHVGIVLEVDGDRVLLEEYNLGDGAYHNDRWVNWRADSTADFIHVPGLEEAVAARSGTRLQLSGRASTLAPGPSSVDIDGDGADEIALRDGRRLLFDLDNDGTGGLTYDYGWVRDEAFTADVDGDGTDDVGLRRGRQYLFDVTTSGTTDLEVAFGRADDTLLVGDFDGDGDDELGVWRDGVWLFNHDMRGGAERSFRWGRSSDLPFVGDFDGDGDTDLGLRRGGVLLVDLDGNRGVDRRIDLGESDDTLLVGDFDGDGADELAMWDGGWFRFDTDLRGGADTVYWWGRSTDLPLTGDFDGDGSTDIALRRGGRTIIDLNLDDTTDLGIRLGAADAEVVDLR